jgi:outer membrane protein assembly factor BamE (lipoprotein component of BamABCDE complex)
MSNPHKSRASAQTLIGARPWRGHCRHLAYLPRLAGLMLCVLVIVSVAGCAPNISRHGQIFSDAEVQQIQEGMTQDQVVLTLGSPNTTSAVSDNVYYYISSTTETPMGLMAPRVIDRRILAIYFDDAKTVTRVANYGLEDGKVIDFVTRETPSYGSEDGLIRELFRNIGRPSPVQSDNPF